MKPSKKQGIEFEPHMHSAAPVSPSPAPPGSCDHSHLTVNDAPLGFDATVDHAAESLDEQVERSVWDEPGLGNDADSQIPADALTYRKWLGGRISAWTQPQAWLMTLGISLLSGPWALVAASIFFLQLNDRSLGGSIVLCAFVPLIQQISKIAIILWVIEKRPYFFTGWFQLFTCTMASTVVFVTVLNWAEYIIPTFTRDADWLIAWTVFFGMHLVTSLLASFGLETVWRGCISSLTPPKLETGYRWFMAAYLTHVVYAVAYVIFIQIRWLFLM